MIRVLWHLSICPKAWPIVIRIIRRAVLWNRGRSFESVRDDRHMLNDQLYHADFRELARVLGLSQECEDWINGVVPIERVVISREDM